MTNSIKRLLRETSYKILSKMGACRSGSHSLHCNSSISSAEANLAAHLDSTAAASIVARAALHNKSNKTKRSRREHSKSSTKGKHAASIPEALLIASKIHLPPVQFHHVHGPNVQLHKNKFVARRTQSFCQALVFSNRVILPNERVYIKVLEIAKGWSGTIRFGFTSVDPATLRYQMPKHACPDMTNAGHTWARALADEVIKRNSVIHFSYNTNGLIHYGINNQDCGIFHANVNTNQNLWFIVDIYGLTAAVELIDPRIHNHHHATSDLDISLDGDADGCGSTMIKSTSAMDELLSQHLARTTKKKRGSRKSGSARLFAATAADQQQQQQAAYLAARSQMMAAAAAAAEGVVFPPGAIGFAAHHPHHQPGPLLPNLSSVMLPSAQQNIYSPMPSMGNNRPEQQQQQQQHDYYQIMTNTVQTPQNNSSLISSPNQTDYSSLRVPTASTTAAAAAHAGSLNSSSISNNTTTPTATNAGRRGARRTRTSPTRDEQAEICQQLSGLQMNESDTTPMAAAAVNSGKQQYSASKQTNHHPVAAARRRLQSSIECNSQSAKESSKSSAGASSSSSGVRAKTRQSIKSTTLKSTASRDNSSPQSKDCPICFERPINCVLYQCGHMCTCYECGVKQWRTQQRTCPICRTVIKDVIKTYMS